MKEHISLNRWVVYFSDNISVRDKAALFIHIDECPACKALYDRAAQLRRAVAQVMDARAARYDAPGLAAVAGEVALPGQQSGSLRVALADGENCRFLPDTLETDGSADRYALNPAEEDRALCDDEDLLRLAIDGEALTITVSDDTPAYAKLSADDQEADWERVQGELRLPLPEGASRQLEILFIG